MYIYKWYPQMKSSSVFLFPFFKHVFFLLFHLLCWEAVFCFCFSLSFLSLQRGAEHWIASQPACPRCGLYRGMRASEREMEQKRARKHERESEGEREIRSSIPPAPQPWQPQPINWQHCHQQQQHQQDWALHWLLLKGPCHLNHIVHCLERKDTASHMQWL